MMVAYDLSRRSVLRLIGAGGASLIVGCVPLPVKAGKADEQKPLEPNAFVKIDPNGDVTVTISKSDMGQGVRTTFAMIVAEELDADWTKVKVENAKADKVYGGQGTGGSSSTRTMYTKLRKAGATARAMLVAAAAQKWGVEASSCTTSLGKVMHPSGKSATYGELTGAAATLALPTDVPLKSKADFKILGKATGRVDNHDVVTGQAVYGQDVKVPNAVTAVVARTPAFGATLKSFDDSAARKVPGVLDVIKLGSGVAVVGENTWAAISGREALKVDWDLGPNGALDSAELEKRMVAAVGEHQSMPSGAKVVEATFDFPFLAHCTMEPMNATADVRDGTCTVWAPTQAPDGAQGSVARMLGIPAENVVVHTTLLGGGFGRRFSSEFVAEAVEISKAMKRPARVLWTREDDMRHDQYRPMSHHSLKGAVDGSGAPVGWSHQIIWPRSTRAIGGYGNARIPYNINGSGMAEGGADSPIPTGAWRSVEHTQLIPANECFIDELAVAAGKDPYEFRKQFVNDDRLKRVLMAAAEKGDWGKSLPKGWGRGIACFSGYGSCVAHVAEVEVKGDEIKVHRVVAVVDPGMALNPKGVEAQIMGACCDALSTTLKVKVTIEKGGVVEGSFPDYDWLRMGETPKIEIHIMESGETPGGMGEVGYPSVPAAVANAVHAATGKRARRFPIRISELV
ncbi:MAG: xanthine dehydrogenase family protein molybdopterin-binding subunit [Armatimonadetes bacterium]|nr:xanthine dehydrogenase family protein molybdopterin-binding subunit [Armatimonadota bacterium]